MDPGSALCVLHRLKFTVMGAAIEGPTKSSEFTCAADWSVWLWWQQCQQHLGSALQEPNPREQGGQGSAEKGHPQQVRGLSMPEGSHQDVELCKGESL